MDRQRQRAAVTERPTRRCASTSSQAGKLKTPNYPTRKSPSHACTTAAGGDTNLGPSKRRGRPRKGARGASASPSVAGAPKVEVAAQKPEKVVKVQNSKVCRDPRKANKSGILAMSRTAWRQSLHKACCQTFGRLKLCSGQHKADDIMRRAQAGLGLEGDGGGGAKSVPVTNLKRPCYIVQRKNDGSASRSRFQITVAGSSGAKILAQKAIFAAHTDLAASDLGTWQVEQKCGIGDGNWWCFEPTHLERCAADRVAIDLPRVAMPTEKPDAVYAIQNAAIRQAKSKLGGAKADADLKQPSQAERPPAPASNPAAASTGPCIAALGGIGWETCLPAEGTEDGKEVKGGGTGTKACPKKKETIPAKNATNVRPWPIPNAKLEVLIEQAIAAAAIERRRALNNAKKNQATKSKAAEGAVHVYVSEDGSAPKKSLKTPKKSPAIATQATNKRTHEPAASRPRKKRPAARPTNGSGKRRAKAGTPGTPVKTEPPEAASSPPLLDGDDKVLRFPSTTPARVLSVSDDGPAKPATPGFGRLCWDGTSASVAEALRDLEESGTSSGTVSEASETESTLFLPDEGGRVFGPAW